MYSNEDLEKIRKELLNNNLKIKIKLNNLIFKKSSKENILIQRISNFALGLGYNTEKDIFYFNYPHIENSKDISLLSNSSIIEEKENGTNLGILKLPNGEYTNRTRGLIEADMIFNNINLAIAQQSKTIIGVREEVFSSFVKKYMPIFEEGKRKGIIDDFGYVVIKNMAHDIENRCIEIFNKDDSVVAIFGELVSKYNPIAVDSEMKIGININDTNDYKYMIFDILVKDEKGYSFIDYNKIKALVVEDDIIKIVKSETLGNINKFLKDFENEEGVVIKTEKEYLKYKRNDVLKWERLVGNLTNIVLSSVNHVFSEEGVSDEDVMSKKYLNKEIFDNVYESVIEEIKNNGVSKEDLLTYYKTEEKLNGKINYAIKINFMSEVASALKQNGIPKEILYKELPNYLYFDSPVLVWNERRQKMLPTEKYSKEIRQVIGTVFI